MAKSKRNKQRHDQRVAQSGLSRFLASDLENANTDVRDAERILLAARQRAAVAADLEARQRAAGRDRGYGRAHQLQRERVRKAHLPVDLDATGDPADLAGAFFNRPGDYFLAKFTIGGHLDGGPTGVTFAAETVLKASEDQLDYLLEVLRQIRGGFGERCRIELYRTHTVEHVADHEAPPRRVHDQPGMAGATEAARMLNHARQDRARGMTAEEFFRKPDCAPVSMSDFTLGPRQRGPEIVGDDGLTDSERAGQVPPWMSGGLADADVRARSAQRFDDLAEDADKYGHMAHARYVEAVNQAKADLTREQIQAQLPGMTRTEAADELGKRPEDIGGTIYATGDLEREKLAAELGVPADALQKIPMTGGGFAYAVKPPEQEGPGRHATADTTSELDDLDALAALADGPHGIYETTVTGREGTTIVCKCRQEFKGATTRQARTMWAYHSEGETVPESAPEVRDAAAPVVRDAAAPANWAEIAFGAWCGPGQYRFPARPGHSDTHLCLDVPGLEAAFRANGDPHAIVTKLRPIADSPQA